MTPEEKAKDLIDKFKEHSQLMIGYGGLTSKIWTAKQCALIAVDEIMDAIDWHEFETPNEILNYWNRVILEIKRL